MDVSLVPLVQKSPMAGFDKYGLKNSVSKRLGIPSYLPEQLLTTLNNAGGCNSNSEVIQIQAYENITCTTFNAAYRLNKFH